MAEIRIRRVPEELKELLRSEAKRLGVDIRAVMLMRLWGLNSAPYAGAAEASSGAHKGASRGTKFIPPTVEEAAEEIRAKGYHFTAKEFVAYYEARGWKLKTGIMKDWRSAMVTWETHWKERQVPPEGKRPEPIRTARENAERAERMAAEKRARGEIQ